MAISYQYDILKSSVVSALGQLSSMSITEISNFVQNTGTVLGQKYYSAQVGDNQRFYTSTSNAATYFKFQDYESSTGPLQVLDPVRRTAGLYWTQEEMQSGRALDASTSRHVAYFKSVVDPENIPININFTSYRGTSEGALDSEEWVLLSVSEKYLSRVNEYNSLLSDSVDTTKVYEDFTFSAPRFYHHSDFDFKLESIATNIVDIHGDYNYFNREYETMTANSQVHEATLPNMYVFFAYQEQEVENPAYETMLTLGGQIDISNHQDMFTSSGQATQKKISPTEKYFREWVRNYSADPDLAQELTAKFANIHLSAEDVKKIQSYGGRKELFPMWMNVEFTTDRIVEFAETLKETKIMSLLQGSLMEAIRNNSLANDISFVAHTEKNNAVNPAAPSEGLTQQYHEASVDVPYFDLSQWVESFTSNQFPTDVFYATFLGTLDETLRISDDPKYNFFKSLMAVILKGKMRKLLRKHSRTIQEVFSGKQCYNETLMYRVEKYDGANTNGLPLQTIYVPNSQEIDTFQYIDTQVKYNKLYTYVIYAYQIVVGTKYSYVDSIVIPENNGLSALLVKNEPSLRLYETKIYEHTNRVLDNPPISPEIEFVPYKGINDRIKLIMNSGIGRYTLPYEIIEFEEQAQIDNIKVAQNRKIVDTEIRFETDDYPAFYEVRRMTVKPKSYRDFAGKLVHQVSTSKNELIASGVGIDDKIKPNQKYYYCIRSVDNHGHVSYPTPIYEVEMVDDKGSIYPIIRICEFDKEVKSQPSIGAKRYIRLKPTMPQTILNEEASDLVDAMSVKDANDITLGVADETVWNKKFKIRLVSKSTGRKIDFNVKFKHQHSKMNEDV